MAYRTNNTIRKHVNNTNKDIDTYSKTGVYKLNCSDCHQFYIGQTGRSFSSRYSEHLKALTTNYIHSTFATHLQNENHSYTNIEHNMEILHYLPKSRKLNTAEPVSYTHLDVYKRQDIHSQCVF